ncbi:MAG TPA: SRPBCC domain-containing protein [Acidobacteriaceae bacterium]
MDSLPALHYVFYFAAPPEKVWEGFVSPETNRIIFMGAELDIQPRPGGKMNYVGPGPDGQPMVYVRCHIQEIEPPRRLRYTFAMGPSPIASTVTVELTPESEATKVAVTHNGWDPADAKTHAECTDGWPRILSRLKTLLETGKTFKPH